MEIGGQAQVFLQVLGLDGGGVLLAQGNLLGGYAGNLGNLLLQTAHAALVGILIYYLLDACSADFQRLGVDSVLTQLLGQQELTGDFRLLLGQIAGDVYQLHTVQQGRLDGRQAVGRGDEHHVAQVVIQVQVVVVESGILLGIEGLQQCGRRIAFEIGSQFVHLVQHYHGIGGACTGDSVKDTARQRSHVSLAVTAYLGLVVHAAEGNTDVLASQGTGDGLAEGGLAHSRRPVEAENRRFHIALQLEHSQILYYTVLDGVQPVVVFVQHFLGMFEVQIILAHLAPGQLEHKLQIVVLDAVVGRVGIIFLQLCKLFLEGLRYFFRPLLILGPLAELLEVFLLVHSELFLDGTQLAVEVILALLLVQLALHLLVDVLLELYELELDVQYGKELHRAQLHVVVGEQFHLVLEVLHLHRGGGEVHQELEIVHGLYGADGFAGREIGGAQDLYGLVLEGLRQGFDVRSGVVVAAVALVQHTGSEVRLLGDYGFYLYAPEGLKDGRQGAVRHLQGLENLADGAVIVEVFHSGIVHGHVGLGYGSYEVVVLLGILDKLHRFLAAYGHGIHRPREKGGAAQHQNRQYVRQFVFVEPERNLSLHYRDNIYILFHISCVKMSVKRHKKPPPI